MLPPPDPVLVKQLVSMGFGKEESERAAQLESTIEAAMERVSMPFTITAIHIIVDRLPLGSSRRS